MASTAMGHDDDEGVEKEACVGSLCFVQPHPLYLPPPFYGKLLGQVALTCFTLNSSELFFEVFHHSLEFLKPRFPSRLSLLSENAQLIITEPCQDSLEIILNFTTPLGRALEVDSPA